MDRGFWATLIGGSIGGFAGLWPGALLGWTLVPVGDGFEGLEWVFVIAGVVAWLGSLLGAYLAFRILGIQERKATLRWLALLVPVVVGSSTALAVTWTDADDFGSNFIPYLLFVASVVLTAYLARRLGRSPGGEAPSPS